LRDPLARMTVLRDRVVDLLSWQELERQDLLRRSDLVHLGEPHRRVPVEVLAEAKDVLGLKAVVELVRDRAVELIDEPARAVRARLGDRSLEELREVVEDLHVARDDGADAR